MKRFDILKTPFEPLNKSANNMPQDIAWDREYKNPKLLTKDATPSSEVKRFFRFLRREANCDIKNLAILDLGCGTGRNANYLAQLGNRIIGIDVSQTALHIARTRAAEMGVTVDYRLADVGSEYPFDDASFDVALDVMCSNSLNEKERTMYLHEVQRVVRPGGYLFVRTLCKDGDKNAKNLLAHSKGPEHDTYTIKEMGITERVFSRFDFVSLYGKYFEIEKLEKITHYAKFNGQSYKRNYWVAYLRKK